MTKLKVNPMNYTNKVVEQMNVAISHFDNVLNYNQNIDIKSNFSEYNNIKNYKVECENIKKELVDLKNYFSSTNSVYSNISSEIMERVVDLPSMNFVERNSVIEE